MARDYERLDRDLKKDSKLLERRWNLDELLPEPFGYDADSDFTQVDRTTLLHIAIEQHDLEFAQELLDRGADVNARAKDLEDGSGGHTPLFHAAVANTTSAGGSRARVEFLLERGADPTIRANPRHRKMHGIDGFAGTIEKDITASEWGSRYVDQQPWIDAFVF